MSTPSLRDPIHFFNERGRAIVNEAHLLDRIKSLEERNRELEQMLVSMAAKREILGDLDS